MNGNNTVELANAVEIEVLADGDRYRGLGRIWMDGILVRSGRLPILPLIESWAGHLYTDFRLLEQRAEPDRLVLECEAAGWPVKNRDLADHSCQNYISLADWSEPALDTVRTIVEPATVKVGEETYSGIRYHHEFHSESRRVRQILDRASWEIEGRCDGNRVLIQSTSTPPIVELATDGRFSSFQGRERAGEYEGSALGGAAGRFNEIDDPDYDIWYQLGCRFGDAQCFDFIAAEQGALLGYFDAMASINSLVHSPRGQAETRIYDMHQFELASSAATTPKVVVFHRDETPATDLEIQNRWTRCYDQCVDHYREGTNLSPERPMPFLLHNKWEIDSYLYHLEETLPLARELGFPAINIENCTESAQTQTDKPKYDLRGKIRNQCCVWDWVVPEAWGGESALRELCDAAHEMGIEVHCWFNSNTTPGSPIHENHPEWCIKRPTRKYFYGAGFEPSLIYLDMNREDLRAYILEQMAHIRQATGLDGLWHDSFCLGMRAVNYDDPRLRDQLHGSIRLVEGLQNLGYKYFTETVFGPLGPAIGSVSPNRPFSQTTASPAVYHDVCAVPPGDFVLLDDGKLSAEDFFRWAAHGSPLCLGAGSWWGFKRYERYAEILRSLPFADRLREINLAYRAARPRMQHRILTETGVLWAGEDGRVFWALNDGTVRVEDVTSVRVVGGGSVTEGPSFEASAGSVYLLD